MSFESKIKNALFGKKLTFFELARELDVKRHQNQDLTKLLQALQNQKIIFKTKDRSFFIPDQVWEIESEIDINAKGFGFVDIDDEQSIFIPQFNFSGAFNNDLVLVKYFQIPGDPSRLLGYVESVISQKRKHIVGKLVSLGKFKTIEPLDPKVFGKFRINNSNDFEVDSYYKFEIEKFQNGLTYLTVLKKIGDHNIADILVNATLVDAGVDLQFPDHVESEAAQIPQEVLEKELENRVDYRNDFVATIDGSDTKDFDDAISVKRKSNGNFVLMVHIADVSHYVKEDSFLDKEAFARGTSIYLVDRVLPMLPFPLSNGICSLNPNLDRLTLTAKIEINQDGENVNSEIHPSVIKSKKRLTYEKVNDYYEAKENDFNDQTKQFLDDILSLSKIIRKFKNRQGYVDFEINEPKIIVDENKKPIAIKIKKQGISEKLIEDFMVRANEVVATTLSKHPSIYRVHEKPSPEKLGEMQLILKTLKINVNVKPNITSREYANLVSKIKEVRFDNFLKILLLRTMQKAIYSPENIKHFGLASDSYTHFTSPIRRYADLIIHRLLREYFFNKNIDYSLKMEKKLPKIATQISDLEVRAVDLERKVFDIKATEFYQEKVGQTFIASIVSIKKFGFFVELNETKTSGLVAFKELKEFYQASEDFNYITDDRRKNLLTIGDSVKIKLTSIDSKLNKLNFVLS